MSELDVRIKKLEPVRGLTIRFVARTHEDYVPFGREMKKSVT